MEYVITVLLLIVIYNQHKSKRIEKHMASTLEELQAQSLALVTEVGDLLTLAQADLVNATTPEQVDAALQKVHDAIAAAKTALTPIV